MSASVILLEQTGSPMLSVEDARAAMVMQVNSISASQMLPLQQLCGRVLAEDIISPISLPPFDNSAMDGYAISSSDTHAQGLKIHQRIAAGDTPSPLSPGHAARIFTGAMIPPGADTVVMQEFCEIRDGMLFVKETFKAGDHIRIAGHSVSRGSRVLRKGTLLKSYHVGLIASLGVNSASVIHPPRVAVFSTGDELASPGTELAPGQIYNSNLPSLISLLQSQGCEIVQSGTIADDFEQTRSTLKAASQSADLIVTSGGVSVGEEDHVKNSIEAEGKPALWKVRMKPGKPVAFGHIEGALFIGLPGNPVSSLITSMLFLLPIIRRMTGGSVQAGLVNGFPLPSGYARLDAEWLTPRPRREFIRVNLAQEAYKLPWAKPLVNQGSDVLSGLAESDALLEIPEYKTFGHGAVLRYWTLNDLCT